MIQARSALARAGEDAAARFFEARGYRIAARNVRVARGELDLVIRRGRELVFCEVKTRRSRVQGLPEESVNPRKQARILRAAGAYLARHPAVGDVRFDVVSVTQLFGELRLRHIPDAFRPW